MKEAYAKIQYLKELRDDYYRIKSSPHKKNLTNRVRLELIESEFKRNKIKL